MRPSFDRWALGVARAASTRGDCSRRQVGAVILDQNQRICGAGYNGTYRGNPGCLDGNCPRGRHGLAEKRHDPLGLAMCSCGRVWPCTEAVPAGSSYDTGPGACIAVHAEMNALLDVSEKARLDTATLYVTATPCDGCLKILRNTRIYRLVWIDEHDLTHQAIWPFQP